MVLPQAGQAWPNQVKFGCLEYQFLRCKSRVMDNAIIGGMLLKQQGSKLRLK
jgi:hypothetical protein